jgi:hypothetical protein
MTTDSHLGTAKIYAFPARGRFAGSGQFDKPTSAAKTATPSFTSTGAARIASGSSWYHEEAIQEERARKD